MAATATKAGTLRVGVKVDIFDEDGETVIGGHTLTVEADEPLTPHQLWKYATKQGKECALYALMKAGLPFDRRDFADERGA